MSSREVRLLLIDDDPSAIRAMSRMLAQYPDQRFATSGEVGLRLARQSTPDLILLDVHMPGIDGFAVCKSLKAEAPFLNVPIVFVTRYSDPQSEARALDLGAADFIAKPYTEAILQARVRNLLELKWRTDAELQAVGEHWRRVGDARVADIVAAASDAIVTSNAEGRVVLINAAACHMFGTTHAQAIGSPIQALLGQAVSTEGDGQGTPSHRTMVRANGSSFPVEMSLSTVGEGTQRLTTVMLRDVGDRERLEAESRLRIEAETSNRTKSLLMSYIAHEMGNPLNGLLGFAQLMVADAVHPLPPEQASRLEHIVTSGRHLEGLMRDVMDLGSFDSGKLRIVLRPVGVALCVHVAAEAVSALAAQAGVKLSILPVSPSLWVAADSERLRQCLVNLLTNAIKYNQSEGWVRIEVKGNSEDVAIAIRDNGIGMTALQREHLFEPFNRLGRQRSAAPGAGLGLAVTRTLVEAMSGHLHVDSDAGLGSCLTIVLPRAPNTGADQDGVQPAEAERSAGSRP